jgi:hypothetical protein
MPGGLRRGNGVTVTIPRGLLAAEDLIKGARRPFTQAAAEEIRDDARRRLGPSKSIGPSLQVRVVNVETVELYSKHPGARAQDAGAYIVPKKRSVLRFVAKDGTVVYTKKPIRLLGKRYLTNALAPRNKLQSIERAFVRVYGPVLKEIER